MASRREAPAVYVAVRSDITSTAPKLTPGATAPLPSYDNDEQSRRTDVSRLRTLVFDLQGHLRALPGDDQFRLRLQKTLEEFSNEGSSLSDRQVGHYKGLLQNFMGEGRNYLIQVTSFDYMSLIIEALSRLITNLFRAPARGGRRRGGAGTRRRPSYESTNVSSRVLSLDFQDNERKTDVLTLTIDNFDLSQFDEPLFKRGDIIEYSFGYFDQMAPIREAVVRKVTGGAILTVESHSKDVLMDQVKRRASYTNATRSDVVRKVAERNGFTEGAVHIEDTAETYEVITQANLTDAQFLRKLANRQGFEFFVDYDGFHWHTRNVAQRPIHKWVYYTDEGSGDIISFNVENDLTRKPAKVTVRGVNPVTGEKFEASADDSTDADRDALQPEFAVGFPTWVPDAVADGLVLTETEENEKPGTNQHAVTERAVDTKEQAAVEAKKIFRKAAQRAVKMQTALVGDATIVGKSVIKVEGMGKRLSGRYYIKNIRHTITGGGTYTMSANLVTDGFGSSKRRGGKSGRDSGLDISGLIAKIAQCARGLPEPYRTMVDQKVRQVDSIIISKDGFNGNGYKPAARAAGQINSLILPGFQPETSSQKTLKNKIMNLVAKLVALCTQAAYNSTQSETTEARVNDKEPEGDSDGWWAADGDALRHYLGQGST